MDLKALMIKTRAKIKRSLLCCKHVYIVLHLVFIIGKRFN